MTDIINGDDLVGKCDECGRAKIIKPQKGKWLCEDCWLVDEYDAMEYETLVDEP